MHSQNKKKPRYTLRLLAMDGARLVCIPLLLLFRMKRLTPTEQNIPAGSGAERS